MIDYKHLKYEGKLKREFKEFFSWWEKLSLKVVRKQNDSILYNRRKRQLELFYGYVLDEIERASKNKLKKIINNRRPIAALYKELNITPFKFTSKR